jgi:phosphatidylserine/phosphatidylglycerophosphate/cardiolipin synthase-like enzyme
VEHRLRLSGHPVGSAIDVRTLTDGGQPAEEIAHLLADWLGSAEHTLDIAIYDLRLPDPLAAILRDAVVGAAGRGVAIRLAYNLDAPRSAPPVPPPPQTDPQLLETLPFPTVGIPGAPDLMHHKYVIRDGAAVWTGSTNWTADAWTREENVVAAVESRELAARYADDFEQLWRSRSVQGSGKVDSSPVEIGGRAVRPWFCPGRGERLAHRIAKAIGTAKRRVRIASPVISSGPILGTLAQVVADGKLDVAGVVDRTQTLEVLAQWAENGNAAWKTPLLNAVLARAPFSGKHSTPYAPGAVHDYMHAKVTVADDRVFLGSFNLSHSGEQNAENVLELADAALADRLAAYIDEVRARYPGIDLPAYPRGEDEEAPTRR